MHVLWFTNDPLPAVHRRRGRVKTGSGHWMSTLLDELADIPGVHLDIATLAPGFSDDQFEDGGVTYHVVGQPKRPGIFFSSRQVDLEKCARLVSETAPDLIHIHGSERLYGLMPARRLISTPCVISLQGLVSAMLPTFFGALSPVEKWQSHRLVELATMRGHFWRYQEFAQAAKREREILSMGSFFIGRTDWDRAHLRSLNQAAKYHHVDEILRPEFREHSWSVDNCNRHSVIFTNSGEPLRGTEILLDAMLIILREYPDANLRLAGYTNTRRGYDRFLRRRIDEKGLSEKIQFIGYLDANTMSKELSAAHVFALSSFIENSPNSLCEAMQVGVPCVASYVGGIPTLLDHGRTGLAFPAGDAAVLADHILQIFGNDKLANHLSVAARAAASARHDPQRVVCQLLTAYEEAISNGSHTHWPETLSHA